MICTPCGNAISCLEYNTLGNNAHVCVSISKKHIFAKSTHAVDKHLNRCAAANVILAGTTASFTILTQPST